MKITKVQLKQIIKEELSGVMEGRQEGVEKEMAAYLIEQGVYKALPDGSIAIFTGNVQSAREALETSGKFNQDAIDYYIDSLHRQIR